MKHAPLIVVLLLAVLLPQPARAQEARLGAPFTYEMAPCPVTVPLEGEVEGRTYDCGVVIVPENYANPNGRTIELAYLRLRSRSATPAPDPLIYLSGGPGGSALQEFSLFAVMLKNMQDARKSRDVIAYDQRGTGRSGRLNCGPFQAALGLVAETRPDLAPRIDELAAGVTQQALTLGACAQGYKTRGVDLAQYNSVSSAKDIAALAKTLGYTSGYNLYGTSYGTRLALNAARTTPETIRSIVLDGVVGTQARGSAYTTVKLNEQYQSIFRLCAADAACGAAYPDLDQRFKVLTQRLTNQPLVVDPPIRTRAAFVAHFSPVIDRVTPDFFVGLSDLNNGSAQGGAAKFVPRLVAEFERGETTLLRSLLDDSSPPAAGSPMPVEQIRPGEAVIVPDQKFFAAPIHVLLDRAQAASKPPVTGPEQWVEVALTDLRQRLVSGAPQKDVINSLVQFAVLPTAGTHPETLTAFADKWLTPAAATQANVLVKEMSRHDVRQTLWAVSDIAGVMGGSDERGLSAGMMLSVNCSEELSYSTREDAQKYIDAAPYPGLMRFDAESFELLFLLTCQLYPKTVNDASIMDPTVSDVPALLFVSALDIQTPRSQGLQVRETLKNSFLVEWNSEGHVIANRSMDGCAGAIAAAFLDQPTKAPDATCASGEYYQIPFLLPGQTWPPAPAR